MKRRVPTKKPVYADRKSCLWGYKDFLFSHRHAGRMQKYEHDARQKAKYGCGTEMQCFARKTSEATVLDDRNVQMAVMIQSWTGGPIRRPVVSLCRG